MVRIIFIINRIMIIQNDSLGAGLSTLVAFELAGSNKEWLPKPITCINIASPRVGTSGFRTASQVKIKINMVDSNGIK